MSFSPDRTANRLPRTCRSSTNHARRRPQQRWGRRPPRRKGRRAYLGPSGARSNGIERRRRDTDSCPLTTSTRKSCRTFCSSRCAESSRSGSVSSAAEASHLLGRASVSAGPRALPSKQQREDQLCPLSPITTSSAWSVRGRRPLRRPHAPRPRRTEPKSGKRSQPSPGRPAPHRSETRCRQMGAPIRTGVEGALDAVRTSLI